MDPETVAASLFTYRRPLFLLAAFLKPQPERQPILVEAAEWLGLEATATPIEEQWLTELRSAAEDPDIPVNAHKRMLRICDALSALARRADAGDALTMAKFWEDVAARLPGVGASGIRTRAWSGPGGLRALWSTALAARNADGRSRMRHLLPDRSRPPLQGREGELAQIEQMLRPGRAGADEEDERAIAGQGSLCVIHGGSGAGKTSLVLAYAEKHHESYDFVVYYDASDATLLSLEFAAVGRRLNALGVRAPGEEDDRELDRFAPTTTLERLAAVGSLLVILDGAESPAAVEHVVPISPGGDILVTTSDPGPWDDYTANAIALSHDDLAAVEDRAAIAAGQNLRARRARPRAGPVLKHPQAPPPDQAKRLGEAIGSHPLALQVAGGLWGGLSVALEDLIGAAGGQSPLHGLIALALGRLAAERPAAAEVLEVCAWYGPYPLPGTICAEIVTEPESDEHTSSGLLTLLDRLGLVELDRARNWFSIHPYVAGAVQEVVEARPGGAADQRLRQATRSCARFVRVEPGPPRTTQERLELPGAIPAERHRMVPSMLHLAGRWLSDEDRADADHMTQPMGEAIELYAEASVLLWARSEYRRAEVASIRAVQLLDAWLATDELRSRWNPEATAKQLITIAQRAVQFGALDAARRYLEEACARLPEGDAAHADALFELAYALFHLGLRERATDAAQRALEKFGEQDGTKSLRYADGLTIVGRLRSYEGDIAGGIRDHGRALRLRRKSSAVARSHEWLGRDLLRLGRATAALGHFESALEERKAALSPDHPLIGASRIDVGLVHAYKGDYPTALAKAQRGEKIIEAGFGREHRHWGRAAYLVASIKLAMGDLENALITAGHALRVLERNQGRCHPWVTLARFVYAETLRMVGDLERSYEQHASVLRERHDHVPGHSDITHSLRAVGSLLRDAGRTELAHAFFQVARALAEKRQTDEDPAFTAETAALEWLCAMDLEGPDRNKFVRLRTSLEDLGRRLTTNHPRVHALQVEVERASVELGIGNASRSLTSASEVLKRLSRHLGPSHPSSLRAMLSMARLQHHADQQADAGKTCSTVIDTCRRDRRWDRHPILRDALALRSKLAEAGQRSGWARVIESAEPKWSVPDDEVEALLEYS